MGEAPQGTYIAQPVVELPVADVERAQRHYCTVLGFTVAWLTPDKRMGAVSRRDAAIFFAQRARPFEPVNLWIFAPDIQATLHELQDSGATIVEPLEPKPWGLMQFTVEDADGHRLTFHHDL